MMLSRSQLVRPVQRALRSAGHKPASRQPAAPPGLSVGVGWIGVTVGSGVAVGSSVGVVVGADDRVVQAESRTTITILTRKIFDLQLIAIKTKSHNRIRSACSTGHQAKCMDHVGLLRRLPR